MNRSLAIEILGNQLLWCLFVCFDVILYYNGSDGDYCYSVHSHVWISCYHAGRWLWLVYGRYVACYSDAGRSYLLLTLCQLLLWACFKGYEVLRLLKFLLQSRYRIVMFEGVWILGGRNLVVICRLNIFFYTDSNKAHPCLPINAQGIVSWFMNHQFYCLNSDVLLCCALTIERLKSVCTAIRTRNGSVGVVEKQFCQNRRCIFLHDYERIVPEVDF